MDKNKTIKEIYNIHFELENVAEKDRCSMNEWYSNLINKTYNQLDLFDVTRMIIQKLFLEMAIAKAVTYIEINPFCGQRYEGELIELLSMLDVSNLYDYKNRIMRVLISTLDKNKNYNWLCEEDRSEFNEILNNFLKNIR